MKTKTTVALAALILAGSGGAALAQDQGPRRDHPPEARGEGRHGGRERSAEVRQQTPPPPGPGARAPAPPPPGPRMAPGGPPPGARQWQGERGGPGPQWRGRPPGGQAQVVRPQDDRWRGGRPGAQVIPNRPQGERFRDARPGQRFDQRSGAGDRQRFVQEHDRTGWDHNRPHWSQNRYPHVFQSHHRFHRGRFFWPRGFGFRAFAFGEILPPIFWTSPDYLIEDWWDYDLPYPPPGYEWVRAGDDALLVDEYDGRIVQVIREIFW